LISFLLPDPEPQTTVWQPSREPMPAKFRTIRGLRYGNFKGVASEFLVDFNKSLDPTGGNKGLISYKKGKHSTKIKIYQDKNDNGKFSKKELIFKGETLEASYDELTNVKKGAFDKPTVKLRKQMHSCDWEILKGKNPIVCTLDYVPTFYTLTLRLEDGGKVTPQGIGDFYNDLGIKLI